MQMLFRDYLKNIILIFKGRNLLWHSLAIILTIIIVASGFDWSYYLATRNPALLMIAFPAVMLGGTLPILAPTIVLIVGSVMKWARVKMTAWALGQAAILGALISGTYKAFTGRIPPPLSGMFGMPSNPAFSLTDSSHAFQFGWFDGGVFWGWPSTHTTIAFAMAVCLVMLYPKNKKLAFFALLYALYVGLGVSMTIHWFSEFVAGAIIGSIIGVVVGKSFKASLNKAGQVVRRSDLRYDGNKLLERIPALNDSDQE